MRWSDTLATVVLFVVAFLWFGLSLHRTIDLRDEGYLYYNVKRVAEGSVPHRDFVGLYGPGVYLLNALPYRLFGGEILPVRKSIAGIKAAAVALAYLIARHLVSTGFALVAAVLAAVFWGSVVWNLNTPYAALYTIPLGMLALLLLLRGLRHASHAWLFAAGVVAGSGVLFKQSLGAVIGYGLGLAVMAWAMASSEAAEKRRSSATSGSRNTVLALWLLAGSLVVAPFTDRLTAFAYALHFLPIHVLVGLVALRFARRGDGRAALTRGVPALSALTAGFALLPAAAAMVYASFGALGTLVYQMFVFPTHLVNYDLPVVLPPVGSWLLAGGVLSAVIGALASLRGQLLAGGALVVGGAAALAVSIFRVPEWNDNGVLVALLSGLLPTAIAFGVLAVLAARWFGRDRADALEPSSAAVVAVLCFQLMMAFQIFPRATFNVTLLLGTLTPLLGFLCARLATRRAPGNSPLRQRAAFAIVAVIPLFLGLHSAMDTASKGRLDSPDHAMTRPGTRGIEVIPDLYQAEGITAFEWMLDHVERTTESDTPIALLTNEFMVHVLSGRPNLFPEFTYYLFLFGWNFLPDDYLEHMPGEELIGRLRDADDPVVVDKDDFASANLRRHYPELYRYLEDAFVVDYTVGLYSVLRKKAS